MLKKLAGLVISLVAGLAALYAADALTLELTRDLLDSDSRESTGAVALLAFASACAIALIYKLVRLVEEWYWRSSSWIVRVFTFFLFIAPAGLTSYYAWDQLRQKKPDSSLIIGLLVATLISLLIAVWGRDIVRRLRKIGTAGVEFGSPQETALGLKIVEEDYQVPLAEQPWKYERDLSQYLYLQHSGVDIHELDGANLRNYRGLILSLGKTTLKRSQLHKALEILKPLDHLRDVTYDELFSLAAAHWSLAISLEESESTADKSDQDILSHYREARRLLERAIKSPNREAKAHWVLAYVYDELDEYSRAVEQNRIAIDMDPVRFRTWGWWNTGVSRLKNREPDLAIEALTQIESDDKDWQEIWDDEELASLRADPLHGSTFENLYREGLWEREWGWLYAALS